MKIKQEAAANRICLLAKKCNAFQFQFRPLNSFAYLRAAKQEQCALRLCPQLLPALFSLLHHSAQSLHSANMQNLMLAHMKTHAHTRMHTHAEQTHTDIHTRSSHFLSTSLSPISLCCILYNDAFFPLLLQLQNSYQRHFPFGQAWASCGLGVAGWRAGTACTQKLFKNSLQVLHKMMEKREDDKINPAHTLTHSDPHTLEQKPPKI